MVWYSLLGWDGDYQTVECNYDAEFTIQPENFELIRAKIEKEQDNNLSMSALDILTYFENQICDYLDDVFDDYCSQPKN